jgi:hypothetical protein
MGAAENGVQMACLYLLAPLCLVVGRTNNMPVYDKKRESYRRFSPYAIQGLPDIHCLAVQGKLPKGTVGWVEAKSAEGETSLPQKTFLTNVATAGQFAALIRSADELRAVLAGQVAPDPETGVYIPSGDWKLEANSKISASKRPRYGRR